MLRTVMNLHLSSYQLYIVDNSFNVFYSQFYLKNGVINSSLIGLEITEHVNVLSM